MRKSFSAIALLFVAIAVRADQLLPTAEGTNWEYRSSETLTGSAPVYSVVKVRAGKEMLDGKEVVKLETLSGDSISKIELVSVDEKGIACLARSGTDGKIAKLSPPEPIIAAPLEVGAGWELEGEAAKNKMHQRFTVVAEESVTVPAGTYQAFHLKCEDSSLVSIKLDRWFVPGTGFVKEATVVRAPGMLQSVTLELTRITVPPKPVAQEQRPSPRPSAPAVAAGPTPSEQPVGPAEQPVAPSKKLTVEVSSDPGGGLKNTFKSDVPNIYVRWRGHDLPEGARVRVAWVAEDVGDLVEPNFIIDETETVVPSPNATARFTLGRPPDGWAEGKYRVEFYVDGVLVETVRVTIDQ
jgi:hypothetical protein